MIRNGFTETQIILNKKEDDDIISASVGENYHGDMDKTKAMFGISPFLSCAENISLLKDSRLSVQEVK